MTGGTTPAVREQLQQVIDELLQLGPEPYERVHVDPELIPPNRPAWMVQADFSVDMYCSLRAAVCRPGLGVVTDLLTVGSGITPVFEQGNAEMRHNAVVLNTIPFDRYFGGPL